MYSVIVVDDEKSIRERIVALLSKRTDFHLLGSYENGYDALMYGVPLEPDLIITDVKMPFVSGLELIERAKEELPAVRSMIISGFDSFDYARKAIELGTLGYISKPIDPEEFNACLDKAVAQLDIYFRLANNEVDKEASRKREREADLERLLTFKAATPQFREKLSEEGIDLHGDGVVVVSFSPDKDEVEITAAEGESLETDLPPLIEDELSGLRHFSYFTPPSAIVLILFDEGYEKEDLAKRVERILARFKKSAGFSLSSGISDYGSFAEGFSYRKLYRHSKYALEYRTVVGSAVVLFYDDLQKSPSSVGKVDENEYRELTSLILYGKKEEALAKVKKVVANIASPSFRDSYFLIINNLLDAILKACVAIDRFYADFMTHIELATKLYSSRGVEQTAELLGKVIDRVIDINGERRKGGVDAAFDSVMGYLRTHFRENDLTLSRLADDLGYSLSYVSAILKRHDTSFTKALSSLRMEEAKRLLLTSSLSLADLAEQLGYDDPYYFSHCFKKIVGVSPLEYRKNEQAPSA